MMNHAVGRTHIYQPLRQKKHIRCLSIHQGRDKKGRRKTKGHRRGKGDQQQLLYKAECGKDKSALRVQTTVIQMKKAKLKQNNCIWCSCLCRYWQVLENCCCSVRSLRKVAMIAEKLFALSASESRDQSRWRCYREANFPEKFPLHLLCSVNYTQKWWQKTTYIVCFLCFVLFVFFYFFLHY